MKREPVSSSSLKEVGYDPATRTLEILFTSGGIYSYSDVPPELHAALMQAESKGRCFVQDIKPHHNCTVIFKPEKKEKPNADEPQKRKDAQTGHRAKGSKAQKA